jgi:hypothetical protein
VESELFQGSSDDAGRLESEPGPRCSSPPVPSQVSERELLLLEVGVREATRLRPGGAQPNQGAWRARDDAILVASELVTNAVVHSGGSPADTIRVRVVLTRGDVSTSLHDPRSSGDTPLLREAEVLQASGRDSRIVKQVARGWRFERDRGYRVWAAACHRPRLVTCIGDTDLAGGKAGGAAGRRRGRS